jgi:hypothetical protein
MELVTPPQWKVLQAHLQNELQDQEKHSGVPKVQQI